MGLRKGRRTVAILAPLAFVVVAVVAVPAVEHVFYLILLSSETALADYAESPPGSLKRRAVKRYVNTARGREHLLGLYIQKAEALQDDLSAELLSMNASQYARWRLFWLSGNSWRRFGYVDIPNWSFRGGGSGHEVEPSPRTRTIQALQELLVVADVDNLEHPDYPGISFTVYSRNLAEPRASEYMFIDWSNWTDGHVLVASTHSGDGGRVITSFGASGPGGR